MSASPTSFVQRFIPLRMPRVCVAVTGSDPAELMEKAEGLVRDNAFLEFRLDYLSRPAMALPKIKRFYEMFPHAVVIATCRRVASGGKFRGQSRRSWMSWRRRRRRGVSWSTWSCRPP